MPKRGRPANQTTEEKPARAAPAADGAHVRSLCALGIGAVVYFVVVMAASSHPSAMTWGIDLPGYLSSPARALVALLALSSLGLLVSGILGSKRARPDRDRKPATRGPFNGSPWLPWLLVIPYGCLLWIARTRSHLLGDQMIWLECFRTHQQRLFSEPLAAGIWYVFAGALEGAGAGIGLPILAVLPVLCGVVAAILLWKISGLLVPPGKPRGFPFLLLLTLGTVELYCGYIESYPLVSVAVLAYTWYGLRHARARGSGIPLAISFGVAVASHLAALFLLPSHAYLVFRRKTPVIQRLAFLLLPALVGVSVLLAVAYQGPDLLNSVRTLWVAIHGAMRSGGGSGPGWVQLLVQGSDLANLWLLVMPAPLLILLSGSLGPRHEGSHGEPHRTFLAIMAFSGALLAAALVVPGSPAQDWDLMSLTVVPLALWALSRSDGLDPYHESRLIRWGVIALALAASSAFVLLNADADAGLRRFKTLMAPTARLSTHERAYGNEKLMKLYTAQGERDSVLVYARRALDADPTNVRYWTNVGLSSYQMGRYAEAIPYLEEALRRDPERWTARYDLGLCYLETERYADAAENIAIAAQNGGQRPDVLHSLGIALFRSGKPDSALAVWRSVLARWPEYAAQLRARSGMAPGARGVIDETPSPQGSR